MEVRFNSISYRLLLLPLLFVLTCVGAFAQANSDVTGIVTDQSGAVVAGANITLTDPATGITKSTISSGTGLYDISGLNAANYNLKVTIKGFQTYEQTGIVVDISRSFRVDVKLTVGSEATTITVSADALTVQSDSNVVSTLINEQQITELPTNGRNVIGLAALGLGVSGNLPDMESPFSVTANYSISFNGLNQAHNVWMIDGAEAYDRGSGGKMSVMPSQDSLGEFQVLASNYPPDYGIASGGTITMSIKSGTSKFHGGAWEFDRNDALDAHNYFDNNNGQNAKKSELRYNVYGANIGGPVFIPHVYNSDKKKTFFFFNEEWRKEVTGVSTNSIKTLPAADEVTTASPFNFVIPVYNPATAVIVPTVAIDETTGSFYKKLVNAGLVVDGRRPEWACPSRTIRFQLSCSIPTPCSSTPPRIFPHRRTRRAAIPRPAGICPSQCVKIFSASITTLTTNGSSSVTTSMMRWTRSRPLPNGRVITIPPSAATSATRRTPQSSS